MSALEFKLPDIGEGVHEGEIVRWIVPEGSEVAADDPVVEVMTDKATVEIPAPQGGVVTKHLYAEGDVAKVGDVIFVIGDGAADAGAPAGGAVEAATSAPAPAAAPRAESAASSGKASSGKASSAGSAGGNAQGAGSGGTLEFKLPDIGEGVHEGEIVRWIVTEGGEVGEDDPVVEVMTDKATVEIPSPAAGVVSKVLVGEGEVAKVGDVIFVISLAGGSGGAGAAAAGAPAGGVVEAATSAPAAAAAAPQAAQAAQGGPPAAPANPGRKVLAAPATRRLARELGVDLTAVSGSGPRGRVKPEDVRAAASAAPAAGKPQAPAAAASGTQRAAAPASSGASAAAAPAPLPNYQTAPGTRETTEIPFRGIRRKTAEAMTRSKFTATHFSLIEEVDCTELVAARNLAKPLGERYGIKVTYMPYIMKAAALALMEFPQLNAELDEERGVIVQKKYVNLGIAVDTPNGLVVPVVKDVQTKGMLQLSADLAEIAGRAREGKLKPDDFADSTFSITNAGNIGGSFATPIINFPEVAIMGVHAMRKMPRCIGDDIVARQVMNLSISIDHRLVDGADGARFMVRVRELLEQPALMLM